jgi:hypothetical protein
VKAMCGALAVMLLAGSAQAETCSKSHDFILSSFAGDLPQKPQIYQDLFKTCMEALAMSNVKDAFVLKAGAIAVIPKNDDLAATANTLAQFCARFRRGTLRFVARRELADIANISRAVDMSIAGVASCRNITGSG